jgi:hypothetical protein
MGREAGLSSDLASALALDAETSDLRLLRKSDPASDASGGKGFWCVELRADKFFLNNCRVDAWNSVGQAGKLPHNECR